MNLRFVVFAGVISQLLCISSTRAQRSSDSLQLRESISGIHRIYLNDIGDNAQIYHGSEYIRNGTKAIGFPYFETDGLSPGSISYQGNLYLDMNLFYSLVTDEVIIPNYLHSAFITLPSGKVDSFTIGSHVFVKLSTGEFTGIPTDGFYEQLFSGNPGIYARREKRFVSGTGSDENKYIQYNTYYLRKGNVFYPVDNKKAFLDLLNDYQDQMKKFIRSNKLKFKKDLESSLVLSTTYYSRLKH